MSFLPFVFKTQARLRDYFPFKDRVPQPLRSSVVYRFVCAGCNASYIGKTLRHLNVRAGEHIGISSLTGKPIKSKQSAVSDHLRVCDSHNACFDDFDVLASANNNFELELKESLLIHRDKPSLNLNIASRPLYLFTDG